MINEKKLIKKIEEEIARQKENMMLYNLEIKGLEYALRLVKMQPKVNEWNVITYCEEDGYLYNLPEDGQRILVSYKGHVSEEEFINDGTDGVYFDSGMDVEEGMAWQPLPEPYQFVDVNKLAEGEQK